MFFVRIKSLRLHCKVYLTEPNKTYMSNFRLAFIRISEEFFSFTAIVDIQFVTNR